MLTGRTVLVVETEFIVALSLQAVVETLGATHVVLASTVQEARAKCHGAGNSALALIDLDTDQANAMALAQDLLERDIVVIGMSADYDLASGVPTLSGTPIILKPVMDAALVDAIRLCLNQNPLPDVT